MLLELRLPVGDLFHFRATSTLLMLLLLLHCLWGNNKIKWQQQRHHQQQQQQRQRGVKLFQLTHTAIVSICQALISISTPIRVIRIGQCVGSNHQPSLLCGRSPHSPITRHNNNGNNDCSNNCNKSNPLSCLDHAQFPFYALAVQLSDLSFEAGVEAAVADGVALAVAGAVATSGTQRQQRPIANLILAAIKQ